MAVDVRKYIPEEIVETLNGSWMGRTDIYGTLRQVLVEPLTPDTIYSVAIRDEGNYLIFIREGVRGPLVADTARTVLFPGEKTIYIDGATRDEMFKLKLVYQM